MPVHESGNGVGLVAVGDHGGLAAAVGTGVIDDEAGVFQLGGVSRPPVRMPPLDRLKHPVAAVGAAAHDEVGHHGLFAVGGQAQHNAAAGIGLVTGQIFRTDFMSFICFHTSVAARPWSSRLGQQLPLGLAPSRASAAPRGCRRAGRPRPSAAGYGPPSALLVDQMHGGAGQLYAPCQGGLVDLQPVEALGRRKLGIRLGWTLMILLRVSGVDTSSPSMLRKPGQDHQVHAMAFRSVSSSAASKAALARHSLCGGPRRSPRRSWRPAPGRRRLGLLATTSTISPLGISPRRLGVEQSLQVGAAAGDQHGDTRLHHQFHPLFALDDLAQAVGVLAVGLQDGESLVRVLAGRRPAPCQRPC